MNNRTDILNELMNISPLVAGVGKENVFAVPDGYFDSISPTVLLCINEDNSVEHIEPSSLVPDGYFANLADNILNKIKSRENEQTEDMPAFFSQVNKKVPFEVPGGYFESLSDSILSAIQLQEDIIPEILKGHPKTNPFEVRTGYFDTLSNNILSVVKPTGEESMPAIFETVSRTTPYEVPAGYFDNLSNNILAKIKSNGGGRVIKMQTRFSVLKYAVAALFTGAVALSIYKFGAKSNTQTGTVVTASALDPSIEKGKTMSDKAFSESLDNLSEEAIVKYLEKNGNEADVSVLTSNIENTVVPEQDDYLLDENTLDNFLKDLKNNSN